jgi:hypothetical protein
MQQLVIVWQGVYHHGPVVMTESDVSFVFQSGRIRDFQEIHNPQEVHIFDSDYNCCICLDEHHDEYGRS